MCGDLVIHSKNSGLDDEDGRGAVCPVNARKICYPVKHLLGGKDRVLDWRTWYPN